MTCSRLKGSVHTHRYRAWRWNEPQILRALTSLPTTNEAMNRESTFSRGTYALHHIAAGPDPALPARARDARSRTRRQHNISHSHHHIVPTVTTRHTIQGA